MKNLLAIDIGTGTQDILVLNTAAAIENCIKMVLPSPTILVARRIRKATAARRTLLFTGVNMGGGPSTHAVRKHLEAGLKVFATPEAAVTFNDDLQVVTGWGVVLVSPDEAAKLRRVERIETRDLDVNRIVKALKSAGVDVKIDGVALAVQDHGNAPPDVSDRLFRFEHLRRAAEANNSLYAFAYVPHELPSYLTRMRSVADSLHVDVPLVLLDTGPAAALGALEDSEVRAHPRVVVLNMGNSHTLAFHLDRGKILGLFEHHTGTITEDVGRLDDFITRLVRGKLTQEDVFSDGGHGCFVLNSSRSVPFLTVTGPRRSQTRMSALSPHFATPHGDMMLSGCFGLARAFAFKMPEWRDEFEQVLSQS